MRRNCSKITVRLILFSLIGFGFIGLFGCGQQGAPSGGLGSTASISLNSGTASLPADGASSTSITAFLSDASSAAVNEGTSVTFSTDLGSFSNGKTTYSTSTPSTTGIVTVSFIAGTTSGTAHIIATSNGVTQQTNIDITEAVLQSMTLTAVSTSIVADGVSQTAIRATLKDSSNNSVSGINVKFATSFGTLSNTTAPTDANGIAEVKLTSDTRVGLALVTADVAGFSKQITVNFIPGPPVNADSSITIDKASIPADGTSTATVTVTLADKYGNPIADNTNVTLYASAGTISSTNPAPTSSGRATFTLTAPTSPGQATISLLDYPDITSKSIVFGSLGSGIPASILIDSVSHKEITVTGVGKNDNTSVTVRLVDETGVTVTASNYFLTVSLLARPEGGEVLSGALNGSVVSDSQQITISLTNGEATFNLRSGILPGVVEVQIEAVQENTTTSPTTYDSLTPPVVTVIPQISIASGPPQTIALSHPIQDAIIDLNTSPDSDAGLPMTPGFYDLKAGLIVTDKYGNAVPDGTVVNLGLIDTVIATGTHGQTVDGDAVLTDNSIDFTSAVVTRNNVDRIILPNDRVVIFDAAAADKSRFVSNQTYLAHNLYVNKAYTTNKSGLTYAVGVSLLGAAIYGVDNSGSTPVATKGTAQTQDGLAPIRLVYPARSDTIFTPVISIFTCSNDSATMVDDGTLSFAAIAPAVITVAPTAIATSQADSQVQIIVTDKDLLPLPNVSIQAFVSITNNSGNSGVITVNVTITQDPNYLGKYIATISASGGDSGDKASGDITFSALNVTSSKVTYSYTAP